MKKLIVRSLLATRKLLDPNKRKNTFELFGYDFLIDEDFNLWLIEVNTNPCLEESSALLQMYLPRLVNDMLKLTVDPLYSISASNYSPEVKGYPDDENMWEHLVQLSNKRSRQ